MAASGPRRCTGSLVAALTLRLLQPALQQSHHLLQPARVRLGGLFEALLLARARLGGLFEALLLARARAGGGDAPRGVRLGGCDAPLGVRLGGCDARLGGG